MACLDFGGCCGAGWGRERVGSGTVVEAEVSFVGTREGETAMAALEVEGIEEALIEGEEGGRRRRQDDRSAVAACS
uniref:Uncharacterized protein n=1 Tax=Oryza sativa subsp. japonica TaxID=39947 RepID=Q67U09_ORYSJ|nr:hypothetical protein [Oryza sativa Japonica Group]BAD38362.1 hypothetical protein [Oryza sativa Japonica Group]